MAIPYIPYLCVSSSVESGQGNREGRERLLHWLYIYICWGGWGSKISKNTVRFYFALGVGGQGVRGLAPTCSFGRTKGLFRRCMIVGLIIIVGIRFLITYRHDNGTLPRDVPDIAIAPGRG